LYETLQKPNGKGEALKVMGTLETETMARGSACKTKVARKKLGKARTGAVAAFLSWEGGVHGAEVSSNWKSARKESQRPRRREQHIRKKEQNGRA